MAKEILILLYGGRSAEREVSVLSAESVLRAINYDRFTVKSYFITQSGAFIRTGSFDSRPGEGSLLVTNQTVDLTDQVSPSDIYEPNAVVFPILHGPMGEDGTIQGFLEVLKLAYIGPNVTAAATTMDKLVSKEIFASLGIPQVPYLGLYSGEDLDQAMVRVNHQLKYPLFVKPANMGSSVGISQVTSQAHLKSAILEAFKFDHRVVVEEGLDNPHEIEVAILGNEFPETTWPGEVLKDVDFYTYQSKYIDNKVEMSIPAKLPQEVAETMRAYALTAYRGVNGAGLSRCDFFLTQKGQIYLNEINAIPGFTQWSMYPLLWENMGLPYADLIEKLVDLAKEALVHREEHLSH